MGMIVRLMGILLIVMFCSCEKNEKDNDTKILNLVLRENNISKNDSLVFEKRVSNKKSINFFKFRNSKNTAFQLIFRDSVKPKFNDSTYYEIDTVVQFEQSIKSNNYLMKGKGINNDAERFLKDSFDYGKERILNWTLTDYYNNIFISKNKYKFSHLMISAPIYNLGENKAILFKTISNKGGYESIIYFMKKNNDDWEIIYQEPNN